MAGKSIVKQTAARIAGRAGTMRPGAAHGRTKAGNSGPCRFRPRTNKAPAGSGVRRRPTFLIDNHSTGKSAIETRSGHPRSLEPRGQRKIVPSQVLSRNAHKKIAAKTHRQATVLGKKTRRKPAVSEQGQTVPGELAAVGQKSCKSNGGLVSGALIEMLDKAMAEQPAEPVD